MKNKIEIELRNGKWLVNGKAYQDLSDVEKEFFNEFLIAMRMATKSVPDHAYY
ncbi:MAG TPA: hypothetical protein VF677_05845 [Flavobacterium sp.]|jgi:hypothetical protein